MKRHPSETLDEVAERLVSIRSALNPIKHKFVWDELTLLAADIRRLNHAQRSETEKHPNE